MTDSRNLGSVVSAVIQEFDICVEVVEYSERARPPNVC